MKECKIENLYNLDETIAKDIFAEATYPWEVLPKIEEFIINLGKQLDKNEYEEKEGNIWIAKSAKVAPTAYMSRSSYNRKKCRSKTLCFYKRESNCWGRSSCW